MTSWGVRCVRDISRTDCWAKMGWSFPLRQAATWPDVARPSRSPNPNDGSNPSGEGGGKAVFDFFIVASKLASPSPQTHAAPTPDDVLGRIENRFLNKKREIRCFPSRDCLAIFPSTCMTKTKVALLGAGFIADIHIESFHRFVPEAEVVAVYARNPQRAETFAKKHGIARAFATLEAAITESGCEVVDICLPNFLHARAVAIAAQAGKHIIIEKPLCMTLEEADQMIAACKAANRKLMYAEELCFAPKYERVRKLVREGAVGEVFHLRQCEKHSGPHSDWFYDLEQSGGGALMDMGCHGLAWCRWMLGGRPKALSVYAQMQTGLLHKGRTRVEEN